MVLLMTTSMSYRWYLKIAMPAPIGMSETNVENAPPGSGSTNVATATVVPARAEAYTNHLSCRRCSPRDRTSRTTSETAQARKIRRSEERRGGKEGEAG